MPALDAVIFLAILWRTFEAGRSPRARNLALLGLGLGAGLLARSSILGFALVGGAWLVWRWREGPRIALPRLAAAAAAAALVASPWLVRNALHFGRPVGMVSTTGFGLWLGNNPATTGGALTAEGERLDDPDLAKAASGLGELEQQAVYRNAALRYIADHPQEAAAHYLSKLRTFFFWSAQTGAWYPRAYRLPYQVFYLTLLAGALAGAARLARAGDAPSAVLLLGFVASVGAVQSVFFVEGRHRWEVESALVILAACALRTALPPPSPDTFQR